MRLNVLHESFAERLKEKVARKIEKGGSRLKKLLRATDYTLDSVRRAIKQGECMSDPASDAKALGPTYLEQTISGILRDLVQDKKLPLAKLNDAREYFGLVRLGRKGMRAIKAKPVKKVPGPLRVP
jgi:hypothetical protein